MRFRGCTRLRHDRRKGFTFVEMVLAAAVLFMAALGAFQALTGALRDADRHQKDLVAERLVLSSIGYMRDIGYSSLVASGSDAIASELTTVYAPQLQQLGSSTSLAVTWVDSPGQMIDATVSASFQTPLTVSSYAMATRIAEGSPP